MDYIKVSEMLKYHLFISRNYQCQSLYCKSINMPMKGRLKAIEKQRIVARLTTEFLIKVLATGMKRDTRTSATLIKNPDIKSRKVRTQEDLFLLGIFEKFEEQVLRSRSSTSTSIFARAVESHLGAGRPDAMCWMRWHGTSTTFQGLHRATFTIKNDWLRHRNTWKCVSNKCYLWVRLMLLLTGRTDGPKFGTRMEVRHLTDFANRKVET